MGAPDLLTRLADLGVQLRVEGSSIIAKPRESLTDGMRAEIRTHKAELLAILSRPADLEPQPDPAAEARRQRVIAMLAERPAMRHAVVTDDADPAHSGCVVLGIGIRQEGGVIFTADVIVPRERYDPFALLELVERHSGAVH